MNMAEDGHTCRDVACTVCGCVCDDLELQIDGQRIVQARGACSLAEPWLFALNDCRPPAATIDGREVAMDEAVQRAEQILRGSGNPLIFGLSRSSTQGQRAAIELARHLRGNIDTTASVCHGPSIMAIQQVGESTCSLGEIRHRADLVMFWGANPVVSHPRHFERYSVDAKGDDVPRGRADRTVVVVDTKPTATSELADVFVQVAPHSDFEVICILRQLIRGDEPSSTAPTGVPLDVLRDLARRMTGCRYGAVFFGLGLAQRGLGHATVEVLLRLVTELNAHTRFTARRLRIPGDVAGADSVLCWQTGFPFAVNFARGYPRYNPGEYSANELLGRGEVDACVLVGSESVSLLSSSAQAALSAMPTIVLDYPHIQPSWAPTVGFKTAVYGIHAPGTAYRMDEIPIPLRQVIPSPYRTDDEILSELLSRLGGTSPFVVYPSAGKHAFVQPAAES
jgi:formylmethanofuran dehydrogenase subunit B